MKKQCKTSIAPVKLKERGNAPWRNEWRPRFTATAKPNGNENSSRHEKSIPGSSDEQLFVERAKSHEEGECRHKTARRSLAIALLVRDFKAMNPFEIVERRQHEIQMETDAALRISASASFLNSLVEQCPEVRREGYDFAAHCHSDPRIGSLACDAHFPFALNSL
jgi:hypothetical protein